VTDYDKNGAAVGGALPTASGAGQVPVSTGAGATYAAQAPAVPAASITDSTATGRALLTATDAAAARTALGAPGKSVDASPFAAGEGWTLGIQNGITWSLEAGDIARATLSTAGNVHDIGGARIERAITWDSGRRWRLRVTPVAATNTSGQCYAGICFRNAAGDRVRFLMMFASSSVLYSGSWVDGLGNGGLTGPVGPYLAWDGTGTLEIRITFEGQLLYGVVTAAGLWRQVSSVTLPFVPSHVGVGAWCDGATVAVVDFTGMVIEAVE
jgi:hypothetical protein